MGSFLIIVVKLYSYKDGDVRNLQEFEYFKNYFRQNENMMSCTRFYVEFTETLMGQRRKKRLLGLPKE